MSGMAEHYNFVHVSERLIMYAVSERAILDDVEKTGEERMPRWV